MIAMAIVAKTMPRVLVRSLPQKNITSLLKILAAFEKVAEINLYFTAFFNEFPVYFGKCHKLSYDIQKYVLIKKWIFDLSWTKGQKKVKCRCKTKIYLHNK